MNWVHTIQTALHYIEKGLGDKTLSPEVVAEQVHFSHVHFSRAFHILTGYTVSEYIRNRRLSVAGEQLKYTDSTTLETALDFGYESPESFAKAFKRFHGVNPSESKDTDLREFHPMELKLTLSQEKPLEWRIEEHPSFYLNGTAKWVSGDDEIAAAHLWHESETSGYLFNCYGWEGFQEIVGVYSQKGYTIKAKCNAPLDTGAMSMPKSKWAVFTCRGKMPDAIDQTWEKIYSLWMTKTTNNISNLPQLEVYREKDEGYHCEIWIGIES